MNLTLKSTDSTEVSDPNYIGTTPPQLTIETFSYDGAGRMLTAEKTVDGSDVSDTTFAYNDLGKLTDTWDKHFGATTTKHVGYAYDQAGLLKSTTYPDNTVVNRTSTWNGRIDSLSRSGSKLVNYAYIGQRVARRAYNTTTTVNTDYSYDNLGRITDITAGTLVDFHYDYVADENNIDKKRFDHRTSTPYNEYTYDDIDRLTEADYLVGTLTEDEVFTMDDLGNRSNVNLKSGTDEVYSVDDDTNRYNSVGGDDLAYDNAGNLTTDKDGYVHSYDCENRIIKITDVNDVEIATFDYDALNRRIRKNDKIATKTTLYYYSDNWQVLAEYDDANSLQAYFVYGNYIDEPLVMNNGSDYFYLQDHLYSPTALVTDAGTVTERYEYDAYGKAAIMDASYNTRTASSYANPYYFTGRRLDILNNKSFKIQYSRARYYDADTGRFLQRDPLGIDPADGKQNRFEIIKQYTDGMNLYEYVKSRPLAGLDPSGFIQIPVGLVGSAVKCISSCAYSDSTLVNLALLARIGYKVDQAHSYGQGAPSLPSDLRRGPPEDYYDRLFWVHCKFAADLARKVGCSRSQCVGDMREDYNALRDPVRAEKAKQANKAGRECARCTGNNASENPAVGYRYICPFPCYPGSARKVPIYGRPSVSKSEIESCCAEKLRMIQAETGY